jgi:uncharacterized protein YndB with AHSA1/START domain
MTPSFRPKFDPQLDLVLERQIDVPRSLVWAAWTRPEHVRKWYTPAPWTVADCEIDLRPGGIFRTVMRSPEGEEHDNTGCYLEIIPEERLVWTDTLLPGFRPSKRTIIDGISLTASVTFEPRGNGTLYTAVVMHRDEEERKRHEEMGFHIGWGAALDQLVALVKTM